MEMKESEMSAVKKPKICVSSPESSPASAPMEESFYERILRKGYGPRDGDKSDKDGWKNYFDDMFPGEKRKLVLDVFGDVLPKEWHPADVRVEWLDGVDKNLTSRSEAFARYPQFQIMFQKGYGPPDGDKLSLEDWNMYWAKMTEDETHNMTKDLFLLPRKREYDHELWEKYKKQIRESQGFDVDVLTRGATGTIVPMFDDMSHAKTDDRLINYSRNSLHHYNTREHSDYTLDEVVKACNQLVSGRMFYITFKATNSEGHHQVFQARVFQPGMGKEEEILLVRPKAEKA